MPLALPFLLTTLSLLFFIRAAFMEPDEVLALLPLKKLFFPRLPLALTLFFIARLFMAFMAFIAFMAARIALATMIEREEKAKSKCGPSLRQSRDFLSTRNAPD